MTTEEFYNLKANEKLIIIDSGRGINPKDIGKVVIHAPYLIKKETPISVISNYNVSSTYDLFFLYEEGVDYKTKLRPEYIGGRAHHSMFAKIDNLRDEVLKIEREIGFI